MTACHRIRCCVLDPAHGQRIGDPVQLARGEPGNVREAPQFSRPWRLYCTHSVNLTDFCRADRSSSTRLVLHVTERRRKRFLPSLLCN